MISIIIPTFQHGKTIAACLSSLLKQTLLPGEIIVVNDGSTDNTDETLKQFIGPICPTRPITVLTQTNMGRQIARNRGFAVSRGDRLLFCDADMVLRRDALEKLSKALDEHPEASFAYCGFKFGWKSFRSFPFDPERLKRMNYIHTSALIRREHFPGFDPAIKRLQDWDVWLTMLKHGRMGVFVDEELFAVKEAFGHVGLSHWRPSFLYHIPWNKIGWKPKTIVSYEEARRALFVKHGL